MAGCDISGSSEKTWCGARHFAWTVGAARTLEYELINNDRHLI